MPRFVIQQHHATAMHFDLRIEAGGVLRSWAVPRGPSTKPSDKRLAMEVEDHSLAAGKFEGVHGDGSPVIVWDRGSYENLRDEPMEEALAAGHASFWLEGEKLRGGWSLRRVEGRRWLLVKRRDEHANSGDPVSERPESVVSGLTIEGIREALSAYEPMKAVLWGEPFSDPDWIFERKLDGVRCLAHRDGGAAVRLLSRTDRSMNAEYAELVDALESEPCQDFVIDGELVAFDSRGITSFSRLQRRHRERVAVFLYVFDVLRLGGEDVRERPLRERKALLRRSLRFHGHVRYTPHRNEHGEQMFRDACRKGLEGVIAKRADSPYRATRSSDWRKLKCHAEQELVIGGFTAPQGARTDFGALLVGHYDGDRLRYAGKVGTGFGQATLRELGEQLRRLEREDPPFVDVHPVPRGTRWVEPKLVAQIGFTEWTRDGRLRHPRYLGLRDDKPARDVVRERPA